MTVHSVLDEKKAAYRPASTHSENPRQKWQGFLLSGSGRKEQMNDCPLRTR